MKLIRQLSDFPDSLRGCAVAIGNFDGVHRGHGVLIDQLKSFASELDGAAVVFTFDPHPVRILRPEETPPPLTWTNRKADLLAELGVDAVVAYPTNKELLSLSYQDFYQQIVIDALGAKAIRRYRHHRPEPNAARDCWKSIRLRPLAEPRSSAERQPRRKAPATDRYCLHDFDQRKN